MSILPERELSEEDMELIGEAVKHYFECLHAGICHVCGVKVENQIQVGRCVYADPCGHRLYQGKARWVNNG